MRKLREWKEEVVRHKFKIFLALIFFLVALLLQQYACNYLEKISTSAVPDIIIDNIPPINLSFIYIWFFIFTVAFLWVYPIVFKPNKIHYYAGQLALLMLIRSFFIILTHLRAPPDAISTVFPWIFQEIHVQNDLFFSGHTALPFLGFLLLREGNKKKLSYFMLILSIILGITVLLMHIHYTIDVLAAFFITYGSYKIGKKIFR